ncbi:cobalamin-binding protein [Caldithrix abyssi]|nr:cobalamin-binding protein [Caldithrix abyssi]
MNEKRIISLLPSGTEIICALGLKDQLVGRSHECDYPPEVQLLPVCSSPKYHSGGTSAEINREVESILREALSIYNVDMEKIRPLNPTHIITQSQCNVCAVSTDELKEALNEFLEQDEITIIDLTPESIEQVLENVFQIANLLDVQERGNELVNKMKTSFEDIHAKTKKLFDKPTVAHIEWIEPIMVAGHWMMTLIEIAGGKNCFSDENTRWIKFEDIAAQNPDKIIIAPCGFTIERTLQDMYFLESNPEWKALKAVQNNEVYLCEGNKYFNRPGPRLVDSLEILVEIFHPQFFRSKHHRSGWINYMISNEKSPV